MNFDDNAFYFLSYLLTIMLENFDGCGTKYCDGLE